MADCGLLLYGFDTNQPWIGSRTGCLPGRGPFFFLPDTCHFVLTPAPRTVRFMAISWGTYFTAIVATSVICPSTFSMVSLCCTSCDSEGCVVQGWSKPMHHHSTSLFKIGTHIRVTVRQAWVVLCHSYSHQHLFVQR